jgi:hypothetical protein
MPYKKESPFASFRDPKRPTRNYNPTNFQMPDINAIFNKTADGDKVEEPQKSNDNDPKNKVAGEQLAKIEKSEQEKQEAQYTRKSLRQDRRAQEKEFNQKLRQARGLTKASTKDITAEDRGKAQDAYNLLKDEKDFRKRAKKAGFNPEDYRNLKFDIPTKIENKSTKADISPGTEVNVSGGSADLSYDLPKAEPVGDLPDLMGKLGVRDAAGVTRFSTDVPIDARRMAIATKLGYTKPQSAIFGSADEDTEDFNTSMKRNKKEMEDLRKSKGLNMKQVNSKGSGFPMIQPNQNMAEPEQIKNRAGRSMESNILTNDPNINQPMNKVAGSNFQRNAKFNDIASGQGVYNPPQSTMPMPNQPMGNQTPQQQTFGQQGSFAAYSNPGRAVDSSSEEIMKAGKQMQSNVDDLKDKFGKKDKDDKNDKNQSGGNDGVEFNAGLRKASAEGKLDNNPKFKAAVNNAPAMKRSFKAFDHAHTKVTKGNLKATERDDAAHMSYLKRDIKYDNKHGGSKKQMLDDEKHISKLAGDLKYDAKKKRS